MTINTRRIISLVFILAFITITPAIMLYAAGYTLSKNKLSFERTGMFIVDSEPEGATVLLNGRTPNTWLGALLNKNSAVTTPTKIKNLLPGEYDLTVKLDGYFSWQKTLTIEPGASTFAENVYLFKNNPPLKLKDLKPGAVSFSPDKTRALIIDAERAVIYGFNDGTEKVISQAGLKGKNVAWSENGDQIVIDGSLHRLDGATSPLNLNRLTANAFNFKWSGGVLYFQDKNFLYRLNQAGAPEKVYSFSSIADYLVKSGVLYLIDLSGTEPALKTVDLASAKTARTISLPMNVNCVFMNPRENLLNLYDRGLKTLYLVDPTAVDSPPLVDMINNVLTADWAENGQLVYTNDFEIWLYRSATKKKILITRISENINQAILLPNGDYLLYSTGNSFKALELDERGKRNLADLLKFNSVNPFILSPDGGTVYFSGKNGSETGLFKLSLK